MRLRVPGNVLLAGEYMVLEKGGLGLCMAVDEYVEAVAEPAATMRITGIYGDKTDVWTPDSSADISAEESATSPLFSELVRACAELGGSAAEAPLSIQVDSSAHYYPDGRKKGLGSSAAVSVAIAALLLRNLAGTAAYLSAVFRAALTVHRRLQGGRGSGYDVAASTFGGLALFTGGSDPGYEKLSMRELPNMALLRGPRAVPTVGAVQAYESWKRWDGAAAKRHFDASNEIVRSIAESRTALEFALGLGRAAELGIGIGEAIGVSAELEAAEGGGPLGPEVGIKALGAGNELGLAYSLRPLSLSPLRTAIGGVEWLEE